MELEKAMDGGLVRGDANERSISSRTVAIRGSNEETAMLKSNRQAIPLQGLSE